MMRMQQSIIDCLMAADHVFTMTRFPLGDYRDMGEKPAMVKQQEDKQKRRGDVVNFDRRWWLKGEKMDRDSKERGGRGEAVKGLRRKGLDFF